MIDTEPTDAAPPPRPSDLHIVENAEDEHVEWRLDTSYRGAGALAAVAALWLVLLMLWVGRAASALGLCALFVPLLHLAAGAWIAHRALVGLFNSTRLTLDRERFVHLRRPIPPARRIAIPTVEIARFRAAEQSNELILFGFRGTHVERWGVEAQRKDGSRVLLPLGLPTRRHADYVASRLGRGLERIRAPRGYRA